MKIYMGSQGTVNQTTSCRHTFSQKTNAAHWRGTVVLGNQNKTSVPVFYRGNKLWVLILVCVIKSYVPKLIPIFY